MSLNILFLLQPSISFDVFEYLFSQTHFLPWTAISTQQIDQHLKKKKWKQYKMPVPITSVTHTQSQPRGGGTSWGHHGLDASPGVPAAGRLPDIHTSNLKHPTSSAPLNSKPNFTWDLFKSIKPIQLMHLFSLYIPNSFLQILKK